MSERMAYVAWMDCGCLGMATVDEPVHAKSNAKVIAEHVRYGHRIERVTVDEARAMTWASSDHANGKVDCEGRAPEKASRVPGQLALGDAA